MSYSLDISNCYSSGDDSFSYISDPYYCPVHYPPPAPPTGICPIHQPYPYYYYPIAAVPQQQVSNQINSSASVFQVRPEKTRRFTQEQIHILEEHFYKVDKYVSKVTIDDLSIRTGLKSAQIRVWFNNKRTRERS